MARTHGLDKKLAARKAEQAKAEQEEAAREVAQPQRRKRGRPRKNA